ncbi:LOW QUALITY PROTEIN: hypothetical protein SETIT_5G060400v2 [Setaria italica]|uniref:Uncharacterized protein n=1 Tax=Setaria italica TaxID=4555 RepID=A0A368R1R3_SETIT|nr:LOW QUALITY PROTEIN: hypothetical protein SETIT_5G060400v2 [Setaria italica]
MAVLTFAVRRRDPVLVGPAGPTPRETKRLSNIDDMEVLRRHMPSVCFYRGGSRVDDDPAAVIRRAFGEALVPYYPLAGRLREVEGRRLVVDCTGEGVLFVEVDADVRLAELEAATGLRPPFPCMDHQATSRAPVASPLLLVQVTRLLCGGFVVAFRINHVMCDAAGVSQFVSAHARGLPAPAMPAAWSREILEARSQPKARDYDAVPPPPSFSNMVQQTFTFSPADVAALKKRLPPHLRDKAMAFDVLMAAVWRARTAALELPPGKDVGLALMANFRGLSELGIPAGYYGNACIALMAQTTAGALRGGSLGDEVALVREAKAAMTAEHVRPRSALADDYFVSDTRHAFQRADFGWDEPVYAGPVATHPLVRASFLLTVRNADGEEGLAVTMVLPQLVMDRFASQIEMLLTSLVAPAVRGTKARL